MTKDLQSALIEVTVPSKDQAGPRLGEDRQIDGRRADRIDFTTVTHLPLTEKGPASDLCEIGYVRMRIQKRRSLFLSGGTTPARMRTSPRADRSRKWRET